MAKRPARAHPKCPICDAALPQDDLPTRPFCSERCKLRDLGMWASGGYVIPGPSVKGEDETEDREED